MTSNLIRDHVLFVSYGGGHAAALAPVAQELRERKVPVAILALTTAASYFARQGLPVIGMKDLVEQVPGYDSAMSVGRRLAERRARHRAVSAEETAAYMGVGYLALQKLVGFEEARRQFDHLDRQVFCPVDFFVRLFELAPPIALIATSAPRSERAALEAARDLDIPSVCLVDLYAASEIEWCASENYADKTCVLNAAVRDRFVERGVPPEKVVITGNPAFDRIGHMNVDAKRTAYRNSLGIQAEERLLVWISQPEPEVHPFSGIPGNPDLPAEIERELAEAFAREENVHIVFRLHPSEDREPSVAGDRLRYGTMEESLDDLLCAADCVITRHSTVGLEAAMIGTPVVQIMCSSFSSDLPLAEMGYAIRADSIDEAVDEIRAVFSASRPPPSTGCFQAATRVSDEIVEIMQ